MKETVKLIEEITKFEDLKDFATAQYNTMIIQAKKIQKLEEQLASTQLQLDKRSNEVSAYSALDKDNDNNDAETTCLIQLAVLKGKAMLCELTLEETKKVEIYAKTLNLIRSKKSDEDTENAAVKKTDTKDLLLLVTNKIQEQ